LTENKNILVIVSHPDDEAIWAGSFIKLLADHGYVISVFCLTNAEDSVRNEEFRASCALLGVSGYIISLEDNRKFPELFTYFDAACLHFGFSCEDIYFALSHSFHGEEQHHFQHKDCSRQVKQWCELKGVSHAFFSHKSFNEPLLASKHIVNSIQISRSKRLLLDLISSFYSSLFHSDFSYRRRIRDLFDAAFYYYYFYADYALLVVPVDPNFKIQLIRNAYPSQKSLLSVSSYRTPQNTNEFIYLERALARDLVSNIFPGICSYMKNEVKGA